MKTKLITFAIPVFNETEIMDELITRMTAVADSLKNKYETEIILIDDGSNDGTWNRILSAGEKDPRFKGIKLAGNSGQQAALMCGYKFANGDAVITIDADMQDPPEVSLELIEKWENGAEVVFAIRKSREGEPAWRLALIKLYYKFRNKFIKTYVPGNSGDFRLLDKKVVKALNTMPEKHPYIRGIIGKIGFKRDYVYYDRKPRSAGEGKYPLSKLIKLGADGIFSMSSAPLKLAYYFVAIFTLIFFGYLVFVMVNCNSRGASFPSFEIALAFLIYFSAIMIFIFLGIVGEYIGRIYDETKNRPLYFVDKTINFDD